MNRDIKLVFEDDRTLEVYRGTTVREVLKELDDEKIMALRINGHAVNADYEIIEDAFVNYITTMDRIGRNIYMKGLEYVLIYAVRKLYGDDAILEIKHALDKSIYCELKMKRKVDSETVLNIKKKMKELCNKDLPFRQINVSREDAYDYSESLGEYEKQLNLQYMTSESVTLYELDDCYNYFYYIMPPSTKLLKRFDLTYVGPNGIALQYPINNIIPKFTPFPKVLEAFKSYELKLSDIGAKYAGDINKMIVEGNIENFIQINEILYNQNMINIVDKVVKDKNIKAILISGPSSSGKTTSSKKIAMYLKAAGKDPFVISTDDYYLERDETPKKPDGTYEFENVEALDYNLFSKQFKDLLDGKEVKMPTFNFVAGKKEYKKKPVKLKPNQIIIVEGLHAVNRKLNHAIPNKNKLRVYISPFTPIRIDRHNHMSTTDIRFIRRLVRDYMTRGCSAETTLTNWMSMRESEEKYIYPYQGEADVIINTSLAYEIGVLRTYAEPLLYSISTNSPYYEETVRILHFLKGFMCIPNDYVPSVSVLREFIGGSYFE